VILYFCARAIIVANCFWVILIIDHGPLIIDHRSFLNEKERSVVVCRMCAFMNIYTHMHHISRWSVFGVAHLLPPIVDHYLLEILKRNLFRMK